MECAPRVSVIMPSYNHARFVAQAIGSVLGQSFPDFELIIGDDASTDGSVDILRSYDDPRIRVELSAENCGGLATLNRCLDLARGEFVCFLCSDDYFYPDKLERQLLLMEAQPELGAVFGLAEIIDDAGAPCSPESPYHGLFHATYPDRYSLLRFFFLHGNLICHPTCMARLGVFRSLGPYEPSLKQLGDMDMWVRMCAAHPVHVMAEPLIAYRVLADASNESAPSDAVIRRTAWEHTRIRRRYWDIDDETLRRAFESEIPAAIASRALPMRVRLALLVAHHDDPLLQLYALETLEDAVRHKQPGLAVRELHEIAGAMDLLGTSRLLELRRKIDAATLQTAHARQQAETMQRRLKSAQEGLAAILDALADPPIEKLLVPGDQSNTMVIEEREIEVSAVSVNVAITMTEASSRPYDRHAHFLGAEYQGKRILEIGALNRPALGTDAPNVRYADFTTTERLRELYSTNPSYDVTEFVNVDFVVADGNYINVLGKGGFDLILASHVAEHIPNLVMWLQHMHAILDVNGELSLIVPDKRFTFDFAKSTTHTFEVLAAYQSMRAKPDVMTIYKSLLWHTPLGGIDLHQPLSSPVRLARGHSEDVARSMAWSVMASDQYFDTHCSIVTPTSVLTILSDLTKLGLIQFEVAHFADTFVGEIDFFMRLKKPEQFDLARALQSFDEAQRHITTCRRYVFEVQEAYIVIEACNRVSASYTTPRV